MQVWAKVSQTLSHISVNGELQPEAFRSQSYQSQLDRPDTVIFDNKTHRNSNAKFVQIKTIRQ